MPRRKSVNLIRDIGVDPLFGDLRVQKLINVVMKRGKKSIARSIVYDALGLIAKKQGGADKVLKVFHRAVEQVVPVVEVRARRVGGGVFQVPTQVREHRALSLAYRWLVSASAQRRDKTMGQRLGYELLEAYEGRGNAVKKKLDVHKMAEANRAFSHYAWV